MVQQNFFRCSIAHGATAIGVWQWWGRRASAGWNYSEHGARLRGNLSGDELHRESRWMRCRGGFGARRWVRTLRAYYAFADGRQPRPLVRIVPGSERVPYPRWRHREHGAVLVATHLLAHFRDKSDRADGLLGVHGVLRGRGLYRAGLDGSQAHRPSGRCCSSRSAN